MLASGMRGKITDSYTVVPNGSGNYPIPSVSFSYFDLKTKRYKTVDSKRLIISVDAGPGLSSKAENKGLIKSNENIISSSSNQFRPFKTTANFTAIKSKPFFKSKLF